MNNLLKYRKKQNLTQEELAKKAGISVRTIQRIEKGTDPKGYTLKVLAKILEVSEDDISGLEIDSQSINYQYVKYINFSSVIGILFPPINILLPMFLMKYYNQYNKITKQIISLQIIYTIVSVVLIMLSPFIYRWFELSKQLVLVTIISTILINLFMIIRNTIELDKKQKLFFRLNFSIL